MADHPETEACYMGQCYECEQEAVEDDDEDGDA